LLLMAWTWLAACQAQLIENKQDATGPPSPPSAHANRRTGYVGNPDPKYMDWFFGCADADLELRGQIAADLDVEKFHRHVGFCLGHCDPPEGGCTLLKAENDCNCLKCMMHCLNKGSYSDSCIDTHQTEVCEIARMKIFELDETKRKCDVDCSAARGSAVLGPLATVGIIAAALSRQW